MVHFRLVKCLAAVFHLLFQELSVKTTSTQALRKVIQRCMPQQHQNTEGQLETQVELVAFLENKRIVVYALQENRIRLVD